MNERIRKTACGAVLFLALALTAGAQDIQLKAPFAARPAILTSVGQSADAEMVRVLLERSNIPYQYDSLLKASDLGAAKTLILAIGGSSKGLGAAGIKAEDELARAGALIKKARELKMSIIGIHVGGEARRGELSDRFIQAAAPQCDFLVVVAEGNKDGLFTRLAGQAKIPMDTVPKISRAGEPLARAFKP